MKTHKFAAKKTRQQAHHQGYGPAARPRAQQTDYDFLLHTKAGLLRIYPADNMAVGLGTVFTRFDDPQAAGNSLAAIVTAASGTTISSTAGAWNRP